MSHDIISNARLYQRVADGLVTAIQEGQYQLGQKLPSERELAETFEVSRPTIREAMIALEIYGVVEIRHGSGNYVIGNRKLMGPAGRPAGAEDDLNVGALELIEARIIVEGGTAAVAAAAITDDECQDLARLVDIMTNGTDDEIEDADHQFHVQIARITNNGPLADMVEDLWALRTGSLLASKIFQHAKGGGQAARAREHAVILEAMRSRDPAAARAAMQSHLEKVRDYLFSATESEELEDLRQKHQATREALRRRTSF